MPNIRGNFQNKELRRFYIAVQDGFGCFKGFVGANSEKVLKSKLQRLDFKPLGQFISVMEWHNYD